MPQVPCFFLKELTLIRIEFKLGLPESLEYFLQIVHLFPEKAATLMYVPKSYKVGLWVQK